MEKTPHIKYRFGFTATAEEDEMKASIYNLEGAFGPRKSVAKTIDLIKKKDLAELKIRVIVLRYSNKEREEVKKLQYADEVDYLIKHNKRNNFIKNLALSINGNTMILLFRTEHAHTLFELLSKQHKNVHLVYGKTPDEEREVVKQIINLNDDAKVVASFQTFGEGINIPKLHNIILASPRKKAGSVKQFIGRGLRYVEKEKTCMTLYDISDDFTHKSGGKTRLNYSLKHAIERIQLYDNEQFPYKIYNIELKNDSNS